MGERYDAYFRNRREILSSERVASSVPFAREASRAVNEGLERFGEPPYPYTLKPEAIYFLELCLREMILLPAVAAEDPGLSELRAALPDDVVTILSTAIEQTANVPDTDITAHAVLQAIDTTWPRLASITLLNWEE